MSKHDINLFFFLIVLFLACSVSSLNLQKTKQICRDPCTINSFGGYQRNYYDQTIITHDNLKDKDNKCTDNKVFVAICIAQNVTKRCVICCMKDGSIAQKSLQVTPTNEYPLDYENDKWNTDVKTSCCSGKTKFVRKDSNGDNIYECCSSGSDCN